MAFLPGLYVAFLGFLLARLLGRWFEPVPARAWWVVAGLLAVLFAPVLVGGDVFLPVDRLDRLTPYHPLDPELLAEADGDPLQADLLNQITPWRALVRDAFAAGRWPLWNPHAGAGVPLAANPQSQILQPLTLLVLPLPLPWAVGATAALRVLVAFVFFFLFVRRQGLGDLASLVGATAYGLCGFLLLYLGWPLANQAALLPVVLYGVTSWDDRRRRADLLLLAVGLFAVLNGGHPETGVYVLGAAAALGAARLWTRARAGERRVAPLAHLVGGWLLAAVLAALATAPLLLPTASYLPQTERFQWTERWGDNLAQQDLLAGWGHPEAIRARLQEAGQRLVPVVAPAAQGAERWGDYWGDRSTSAAASGFAGTFALLAALVGLAVRRRSGLRFRDEGLFALLGLFALVAVVRFPGYEQMATALPLVGQSATLHRRLLLLLAFATSYLGAATVERLLRQGLPRRTVGVTALAVAAALVTATVFGAKPGDPQALVGLRTGYLGLQLAVLGAGAWLLASGAGRPRRRLAAWGAVGLVAVELLAFHRPATPGAPAELFYPQTEPLRVLGRRLADTPDRMIGLGASLPPEMAAIHDLSDVRALGPTRPAALRPLLVPLGGGRIAHGLVRRADHPNLDLLAVRYVLTPPDHPRPAPDLVEIPLADPRHGRVWERPHPLPLAYLPASAVALTADSPWSEQLTDRPDRRSLVLRLPGGVTTWQAERPGSSSFAIDRFDSERLVAHGLLVEPRLLVTGIYQDGGWHLLADSADGPTTGRRPQVLANGPLVAGWLPAGELAVTVLYRPLGFFLGCLLAALGVAGAAAVAWRPPLRRPSSPPETRP